MGEGMLRFPDGARLDPGQAVVIAHHGNAFFNKYGLLPDYELVDTIGELPDLMTYPNWGTASLNLYNEGDELLILDGLDQIIDAINYGNSTFFFSKSIPISQEGCTLERYPGNDDTDSAADWREQCQPSPGLPALPTPTTPPSPTPVPILIFNEIHHAPDLRVGDANGDGVISPFEDEFVEIYNHTGAPVNLGGWCLSDAMACRHIFPSPSWVMHGCSVVVFGQGTPTGDFGGSLVQISSSGILSLNDAGDTLTLIDAWGKSVLDLVYGQEYDISGESWVRYPDISGDTWIPHSSVVESGGALFSPGTYIYGDLFPGCSPED